MHVMTTAINNLLRGLSLVLIIRILEGLSSIIVLPLNFFTVIIASFLEIPGLIILLILGAMVGC